MEVRGIRENGKVETSYDAMRASMDAWLLSYINYSTLLHTVHFYPLEISFHISKHRHFELIIYCIYVGGIISLLCYQFG